MVREVKEYPIPLLKRRQFINKLKGLGLIVEGGYIYPINPKEGHRIEHHYLPVAIMNMFSYRPVNEDEPAFRRAHREIRGI